MDETSNQSLPTNSPTHNHNEEKIDDLPNDTTINEENRVENNIANNIQEPIAEDQPNSTIKSESQIEPKEPPPNIPISKPVESRPKPKNAPKSNHNLENRKTAHAESSAYTAVQEILKEQGAIKWDRNVSQQLQEFMFQITTQILDHSKNASEHRESSQVNIEDVNEAVESFGSVFNVDRVEYEQGLQELSEKLNSETLPKIRSEYGLHTPNERFMIVQPDYRSNGVPHKQMRLDPMAKPSNSMNNLRPTSTNMYSTSFVEQSFKNQADDPSEFD